MDSRPQAVARVLLLAIALVSTSLLTPTHQVAHGSTYNPRTAILIDGDNSFTLANGVVSGTGTKTDPFTISGWEITGAYDAVTIQNTKAFFVLQNLYLHSNFRDIHLDSIVNGMVQNTILQGSVEGVVVEYSSSVTITSNSISSINDGVYVLSSQVTVNKNDMTGIGINGSDASVTSNRISGTVGMWGQGKPTVSANNITGGYIFIADVATAGILDNRIAGAGIHIGVPNTSSITLTGNNMTGDGIEFSGPTPAASFSISKTNIVNGNPVYFYDGCKNIALDGVSIGQLLLVNCQNVSATNLRFNINGVGLYAASVSNLLVQKSVLNASMSIQYSSNVQARDDNFTSPSLGRRAITVQQSTNTSISHDIVSGGLDVINCVIVRIANSIVYAGVSISSTRNLTVESNTFSNSYTGLALNTVTNASIFNNHMTGNTWGSKIDGGSWLNITRNQISYNQIGVLVGHSDMYMFGTTPANSTIYGNSFLFNTLQAEHDFPSQQDIYLWDNGYPTGGNYWSDYNGIDDCTGPAQNICTGPDGIGDTPYTMIKTVCPSLYVCELHPWRATDRYPSMQPFGNYSQDKISPAWPSNAQLTAVFINSTATRISWTSATDDLWVSSYKLYRNQTLLMVVAGSRQDVTLTGLTLGATYVFKIEAGDPAANWSTNGPSLQWTQNPEPQTNPPPQYNPIPSSPLSQYMYPIIAGVGAAAVVVATLLLNIRRRKKMPPSPS